MKKVLFIADQPQRISGQIQFARKLQVQGFETSFVLSSKINPAIVSQLDQWQISHSTVTDFFGNMANAGTTESEVTARTSFIGLIKATVKKYTLAQVPLYLVSAYKFKKLIAQSRQTLARERPYILMTNGDRAGLSLEQSFLIAASQLSIRSIVPFTSIISDGLLYRVKNPQQFLLNSGISKRLYNRFENQTKTYEGNEYSFYNLATTFVLNRFGALTKNPWFIGNGLVNHVCLDSQLTVDCYRHEIMDLSKFSIMGDVSLDHLYQANEQKEALKLKAIEKYGLDQAKKIILVAVPQLAEHKLMVWDQHWQEINTLMNSLKASGENVLLSLHPKMNRDQYLFLEKDFDFKILEEPLNDQLPLADLFVAINSSTVLWSVILGIKTIILDYFNLSNGQLVHLSSIDFVKDRAALVTSINNGLSQRANFEDDWKRLSKAEVFDGQVIKRYGQLITKIADA